MQGGPSLRGPRIGDLWTRVMHQTEVVLPDGQGGFLPSTWTDVALFWADVTPLTSFEMIYQEQLLGRTAYKVRARSRDIKFADRLLWEGVILQIKGVIYPDRHSVLLHTISGIAT